MNFDLDFYKGKKVFVTGHTGFKGSWLCKMLANAGAIVTGYSLNPPTSPSLFEIAGIEQDVHSVIGDIRDFKTLKAAFDEAQPEMVLHLAAQPIVRDSYRLKRFLIRGCSNGKDREKKKCNEKYYIWRYFKSVSNCSAFFNAYGYDLFHGCPVSWLEFAFYVNSSGIKFG